VIPELRCDDVAGSIEALAAGELELTVPGAAEHLRACDACQQRLALARRLDQLLLTSTVPVPGGFTPRVAERVRAEGRRRERVVDWIFNVSVFGAGVAVLAAIVLLMEWTGVGAVLGNVAALASEGLVRAVSRTAVDSFLYIGGSLAGITAFLMWRWSEGERFL